MKNIESNRVLFYFKEISKIPRCSRNEKEVSDYLRDFAKANNLEVIQDEKLNIIIKKNGTKGYENSPTVVLQGHMDMVCEKSSDSNHDFSKDPIELTIEDGFLKANNTTLGADNGIAIAMALAILESDTISHPPLEVLITVTEETDMSGAKNLSEDVLDGELFINLDSEGEGVLTAGSAGGVTIYATYPIEEIELDGTGYLIKFDGLQGGHSGMEIDKNRGNMLKVINEFLIALKEKTNYHVNSFVSGTLSNAIPRYGELVLSLEDDSEDILKLVKEQIIKNTVGLDGILTIEIDKTEISKAWSPKTLDDISNMIQELPTGVNSFVNGSNLVESSNNLALIKEKGGEIYLEISIRSSNIEKQDELVNECIEILKRNNFQYKLDGAYPTWEYKQESKLRDLAKSVYNKMYNKDLEIVVLHAGLECGVISSKYPNMDIISIGPNISGAHTPKEALDIASSERVYEYLIELLSEIK